MTRSLAVVALAAITALAAAIRLHELAHPLWLDELMTGWVVAGSWSQLIGRAEATPLPPLYYALVKVSAAPFADPEVGLRVASLAAGVLLVPAAAALARALTGSAALALLAAALVALDGTAALSAQQARPYALAQLVAVLHVHLFAGAVEGPDGRSAPARGLALGILTALLPGLHFTAGLLLAAEAAALLWLALRRRTLRVFAGTPLLVAAGTAAPLLAVLVPQLLETLARRGALGSFVEEGTVARAVLRFGALPYAALPLMLAFLLDAALRPGARTDGAPAAERTAWRVALVALWFAVPVLGAWALTEVGLARLDLERYVLVASVAPIAGLALGTSLLRHPGARALSAGLALLLSQTAGPGLLPALARGNLSVPLQTRPPDGFREAVAQVNAWPPDDRPVFVRSTLVEAAWLEGGGAAGGMSERRLRAMLLAPVSGPYRLQVDAARLLPIHELDDLRRYRARVAAGGGFVLLARRDPPGDEAYWRALLGLELQVETVSPRGALVHLVSARLPTGR